MESDAGADRDIGDAVQRRDANSKCPADRADHSTAWQVRQDRREECVLLVSESQGQAEAEAEARNCRLLQSLSS